MDTIAGSGSELQHTPKNILVTGGAGFIGSHVAILLAHKYPKYKIVVLDKLDYCASLDNLSEVNRRRNFKFVKGNICSSDLVNFVLEEEEIDTVLHLAAQTHVDNSFGNSFSFTQNNILGTHVLLESAKVHGIKRFVHCSTDEVYGEGTADQEPMFEDNVLEPTNPYAATKAGAEFLAKSYHRSFNLPVIITRGNNVYGPHQYPEKLIPKFINLLQRARPLTLHGNGLNTRNFLYVTDVAKAFDCVLHYGETGKIYNIGGTHEKTNVDVAKDLIRKMELLPSAADNVKAYPSAGDESAAQEKREGLDTSVSSAVAAAAWDLPKDDDDSAYGPYLTFVEDRPFNDLRYSINSEALRRLGWREEVSWEDGLAETIQWYIHKAQNRWGNIESALVPHPKGPLPDDAA
ncbi:dtdp-glucose-dehydratase [Nannochloropsis oceanica]